MSGLLKLTLRILPHDKIVSNDKHYDHPRTTDQILLQKCQQITTWTVRLEWFLVERTGLSISPFEKPKPASSATLTLRLIFLKMFVWSSMFVTTSL